MLGYTRNLDIKTLATPSVKKDTSWNFGQGFNNIPFHDQSFFINTTRRLKLVEENSRGEGPLGNIHVLISDHS